MLRLITGSCDLMNQEEFVFVQLIGRQEKRVWINCDQNIQNCGQILWRLRNFEKNGVGSHKIDEKPKKFN